MSYKIAIKETFFDVLKQTGAKQKFELLDDNVLLLESGLDSLGFAILVATLEEKFNYDPFALMDEPYYPSTFGEFVRIYDEMDPFKDTK